jgi:D-beta-D-heptose 7-phosphate kinase/D-beta-D-heptose 1-phosphate adenosyltransferase
LAPNAREAGAEDDCAASVRAAGERLLERCGRAFISCGPRGIAVFERGMQMLERPSEVSRNEVGDVTGAGDTVTATVGLSLAAGASPAEAAELAMHAAGVVVRQRGVAPVTREALDLALAHQAGPPKLRTLEEAEPLVRRMQAAGKRVVWTNGCFDILHAGHIVYLQHAAAQGDVLIVGMNDDASVTALKGPGRPVVPEEERALVLAALACVDYVVPFGDPDTVPLLDRLRPDVYAKGGDYTLDTINQDERGLVEGYGGTIALLPGVSGRSTTRLIDRMRR